MKVALYADTEAWDAWSGQSSLDEAERDYAENYSSYVLRIYCDITKVNSVTFADSRVGMGCCLRDESQDGGGYCTVLGSGDSFTTYFLTETNFENVVGGEDLSTQTAVSTGYYGITDFYIETIDSTNVYNDAADVYPYNSDGSAPWDKWEAIKF